MINSNTDSILDGYYEHLISNLYYLARMTDLILDGYSTIYRLVWAKKVSLAAICLDISSASFGILFSHCRKYDIPVPL